MPTSTRSRHDRDRARAARPRHSSSISRRRQPVALLPIAGDPSRGLPQDVRAQMLNPHRRQDQKTAVPNHPLQLRAARGIRPAQPLIARTQRQAAALTAKPPTAPWCWLMDQVADLRAAQRAGAQRVMRRHHGMPSLAGCGPRSTGCRVIVPRSAKAQLTSGHTGAGACPDRRRGGSRRAAGNTSLPRRSRSMSRLRQAISFGRPHASRHSNRSHTSFASR